MENPEGTQNGFDERAALDELERLRQEIERYRAKRKAVAEEFDEFVRSFKTPPNASSPPPRGRVEPQTEPPRVAAPVHREDELAVTVEAAPAPAAAPAVARRAPWRTPALIAGAAVLLAGGTWATWIVTTRTSHNPTAPATPDARSPAPSVSRPVTGPANPSAASISELRTTGAVWVRVIADGERVVERELPANTRVPLTAQKTIVIRAGNAGAVRVTLAGRDQGPLGPEGTVVTRTFSVAQTPPR
jgi:hypothetical protein